MKHLHSHRGALAELGVWAKEGLSAGEPVCLTEGVSSSAGAHGYGGLEARDDGQVEGELGTPLESVLLRLGLSVAWGLFPQCSVWKLLSPALHLQQQDILRAPSDDWEQI